MGCPRPPSVGVWDAERCPGQQHLADRKLPALEGVAKDATRSYSTITFPVATFIRTRAVPRSAVCPSSFIVLNGNTISRPSRGSYEARTALKLMLANPTPVFLPIT